MSELAEVRRYWPRARVLRGGYVSTHTRSGSGARVRFNWCYIGKQFVFQFERLHTNRRRWVTVRVLNCGDDFPEAMRAAGFGPRTPGLYRSCNGLKRNDCAGRILSACRIYPHQWFTALADRQRPRKGVRLGERKRREAQP